MAQRGGARPAARNSNTASRGSRGVCNLDHPLYGSYMHVPVGALLARIIRARLCYRQPFEPMVLVLIYHTSIHYYIPRAR